MPAKPKVNEPEEEPPLEQEFIAFCQFANLIGHENSPSELMDGLMFTML